MYPRSALRSSAVSPQRRGSHLNIGSLLRQRVEFVLTSNIEASSWPVPRGQSTSQQCETNPHRCYGVPTRRASLTHELQTIRTRIDSGVVFATFDNPPINLIGPELVRDLIDLLDRLEQDQDVRVV